MTKIFLAGGWKSKSALMNKTPPHYLLDTFYYFKSMSSKVSEYIGWVNTSDGFLLDSGAFTFMNKSEGIKNINLDEYIQKYIDFIRHETHIFLFWQPWESYEFCLSFQRCCHRASAYEQLPYRWYHDEWFQHEPLLRTSSTGSC